MDHRTKHARDEFSCGSRDQESCECKYHPICVKIKHSVKTDETRRGEPWYSKAKKQYLFDRLFKMVQRINFGCNI